MHCGTRLLCESMPPKTSCGTRSFLYSFKNVQLSKICLDPHMFVIIYIFVRKQRNNEPQIQDTSCLWGKRQSDQGKRVHRKVLVICGILILGLAGELKSIHCKIQTDVRT